MKELRNNYDTETTFDNLEKAKAYYMPDLAVFPDEGECAAEIEEAETLEELAEVLNKYSDIFGNGSRWEVKEI